MKGDPGIWPAELPVHCSPKSASGSARSSFPLPLWLRGLFALEGGWSSWNAFGLVSFTVGWLFRSDVGTEACLESVFAVPSPSK